MYHKDNQKAKDRLIREYEEHGSLYIAVDFDNTLYDYHKTGMDLLEVQRWVREAMYWGHNVFIFTGNTDTEFVKSYLYELYGENDIPINTNALDNLYPGRKPFYNLLLDDRAGLDSSLDQLKYLIEYQMLERIGS